MTDDDVEKKLEQLSPQGRRLYQRLLKGEWYRSNRDAPRAMGELVRLGLVKEMMRVRTTASCWVPKGALPLQLEQINPSRQAVQMEDVWKKMQRLTRAANALVDDLDRCVNSNLHTSELNIDLVHDLCRALDRPVSMNFRRL